MDPNAQIKEGNSLPLMLLKIEVKPAVTGWATQDSCREGEKNKECAGGFHEN